MKQQRSWTDGRGIEHQHTDEEVVTNYLTGYLDHYSGGELGHMQRHIENLTRNTAELLLAIDREKVLNICEDKS